MRVTSVVLATLLAGGAVVGLSTLPGAAGTADPVPAPAVQAPAPELRFAYRAEGGEGFLDQVLTIANTGDVAAVPSFDVVPLDAAGEQVRGIRVDTAFGSDRAGQVVPAHTEVIDVLTFVGVDPAEVAKVVDVRVEEVRLGAFAPDVPPANDLRVARYDVAGQADDERTLGRIELRNTYDGWIRVRVVGLELTPDGVGATQQVTRVTELAGPLDIAPGATARARVPSGDRDRFYGSVRAYLVR